MQSRVRLFVTPWTAALQASLSWTISQSLPKFMSIESVMPSNHLILCPLLLPSVFPSIRVFSNESAVSIRWPKYWDFSSASVLPKNIQGWFPLALTGLISLLSKGLSYKPIYTHIYVFIGIEIESQQHFSTLCFYKMENTVGKKKKKH